MTTFNSLTANMSLKNTMLAGGAVAGTVGLCLGLKSISYGGLLIDHNYSSDDTPSQAVKDLEESTENQNNVDAQAKATQTKALAMLEAEGIQAEAVSYPTTGDQVVFMNANSFAEQGTYLPMEYKGEQPEYQGVMALRPYGVSAIANGSGCLIVDGDQTTEPIVKGC